MKNRKLQLEVLKSLIKEEVKKQFYFNENVDVASAVASADVSSAIKLGTPELVVDKSQDGSGLTVYINNVNGYKSFSISGFDDYFKIIPANTKKGDNYIKVIYGIKTTSTQTIAQMLIDSMNFKMQTSPTDKSITLELYYDFKEHAKYNVRKDFDINKGLRQGILHGNHRTDEKIDIFVPVGMQFKGKLS